MKFIQCKFPHRVLVPVTSSFFTQDVFLSTQVSLQLISQLTSNKTTNRFQVMKQSHLQMIQMEV